MQIAEINYNRDYNGKWYLLTLRMSITLPKNHVRLICSVAEGTSLAFLL